MMQPCASAAKLLGGGPIFLFGMVAKPSGGLPPPRIISSEPLSHGVCRSRCRVVGCAVPDGHCAGRKATPCGTSPTATKRHKAISNLRAKATIITLQVA